MAITDKCSDCGDPDQFANPSCQSYPWFELDWRVDDPDAPSELTISPGDGETTTAWISIHPAHAVSVEELR